MSVNSCFPVAQSFTCISVQIYSRREFIVLTLKANYSLRAKRIYPRLKVRKPPQTIFSLIRQSVSHRKWPWKHREQCGRQVGETPNAPGHPFVQAVL